MNLEEIVCNKKLLLYGSSAGSELIRNFFIDSGAASVTNVPLPENQTSSITDFFHAHNEGLLNPSNEVKNFLHRIDPLKEAIVYAGSFVSAESLDGRVVIGRRHSTWCDIEKKKYQSVLTAGQKGYNPFYMDFLDGFLFDDLFDYCIQNKPCIISGDVKGLIAMGSDYVYMIHPDTPLKIIKKICTLLYLKCDGVRVAPYNEGIPATFYGFINDNQYILFGPVEAIVGFHSKDFKVKASGILIPISLPNELIIKAKKNILIILKKLISVSCYRGAFGIDGCFFNDYFIVHEINPRVCAGFSLLSKLYLNAIPFGLIDLIIREGEPEKCKSLLTILKRKSKKVCLSTDLKLWEDNELENDLRNKIPQNGELSDLNYWKKYVINKSLIGCIPFKTDIY
ncbi:MAG: hypothetical protein KKG99_11250 [Bacteroidetes bacterium]|nr:hypothetical protein [Bacteroidota bacterium]